MIPRPAVQGHVRLGSTARPGERDPDRDRPSVRVAVLGSTGSIGRSTLEVVARHPDRFEIVALTTNGSVARLADQVAAFAPEVAVVARPDRLERSTDLPETRWKTGRQALLDVATSEGVDVVVNALVGATGLEPTLAALEGGKRVALANKESLVAGGALVLRAAERGGGEVVPVDSEHSAILQCIEGYERSAVHRIVLTASGGPFRDWPAERLEHAEPSDALQHPTWEMGAKITIDSATLANKALEVIEAHFLYGLWYDSIDAVVHPQSVIHSFVEFVDGSVLAQMGFPTMELPILYALSYPTRVPDAVLRTFDPVTSSPLTFEEIDRERFPIFGLGIAAGRRGGTAPAAFNAANEVAVEAFLRGKIGFTGIPAVVERTLEGVGGGAADEVEGVLEADREARARARSLIGGAEKRGGKGS